MCSPNEQPDSTVTWGTVQTFVQCLYGLAILYAVYAAGILEGGCH